VTLTGVLAHFYDPAAATGFFHEFSGLVVFAAGLLIVYGLANLVASKTGIAPRSMQLLSPAVPDLSPEE